MSHTNSEPGYALDALVAEHVMGWRRLVGETWTELASGSGLKWLRNELPRFSSDMRAAWTVVEKLAAMGFSYCIEQASTADKPTVHFISDESANRYPNAIKFIQDMERISISAQSLEHSICLAALTAVGYEFDPTTKEKK